MNRILAPLVLVSLALLAGCASEKSAEGATAAKYSREEVRGWSKDHVVVLISRRNAVRVDNESVSPAQLPERLAAAGKATPGRPVIVMLQDGGDDRAVAFVREQARKAGLGAVEVR